MSLTSGGRNRRARRVTAATTTRTRRASVSWCRWQSLAFLSDAAAAGRSSSMWHPPLARARQITTLAGFSRTPLWSPDGQTVAILFTENAPAPPPHQPDADIGVVEDILRAATHDRQRGERRCTCCRGDSMFRYDWSPDGPASSRPAMRGDDNCTWLSSIPWIDIGDTRSILKTRCRSVPVSPDGKQVAFVAGYER